MSEIKPSLAIADSGFVRFLGVKFTDSRALIACLSLGFFIRLIPEVLAFSSPIGFDTVYYAGVMKNGLILSNWGSFFTSTWLLNAFIVPLYNLSNIDPFLLLKVVAPLLFGFNVAGIYWFARKNLGWGISLGLVAGVFFALQIASLRISWDLLRNTLGLGLLLFAFSSIKEVKSNRGLAVFAVLSLLSVFAHEYAAVSLLFVALGLVVWSLVKGHADISKRLLLGVSPALAVFCVGLFLRIFPVRFESVSNVIRAGGNIGAHPGKLFFMVDYFQVQNAADSYGSYWALAFSVLALFAVLFLPYLYLVAKGSLHNRVLTLWTALLLVGAFGCLVVPFFALELWYRWMFMMAYPLTFYAVYGSSKLYRKALAAKSGKRSVWKLFDWKVGVMLLATFSLGVAYLANPVLVSAAEVYIPSVPGTINYFSVAPTVPYQDVKSVEQAMIWLDGKMDNASCVVLRRELATWGSLYLDKSHMIFTFDSDTTLALNTSLAHNFSRVYFVWWNTPIAWYNVSVPASFTSVQDFGRISVYVYEGLTVG